MYWTTTSLAGENIQDLEKLLDILAPDVRFEIQQYALMGSIPKVIFMKGMCFQPTITTKGPFYLPLEHHLL